MQRSVNSLQWDIFCKVIDNFGDIGICWRLAADLAARGQRVRLWVDDASALAWMAPLGCDGVQVLPWGLHLRAIDLEAMSAAPPDVMIEAFGCEIAPEFIAACARIDWAIARKDTQNTDKANPQPVWINLEYLTAELYAERNHGLPSLVQSGPLEGWTKWFWYPGFTAGTAGLLRELDLPKRQAAFDRNLWLKSQGIDVGGDTAVVSLFCYEPPALAGLLAGWVVDGLNGQRVHLLVTSGRATNAVLAVSGKNAGENAIFDTLKELQPNQYGREQLSISYLPPLTQAAFDHLLWASDLNFVRGEDSVIRAIWAGRPFVWQIYPQGDGVHLTKLDAFLNMLGANDELKAFHRHWNADQTQPAVPLPALVNWQQTVAAARDLLLTQDNLANGVLGFALKNR